MDIQNGAVEALSSLTLSLSACDALVASGGVPLVVFALRAHIEDKGVIKAACRLLHNVGRHQGYSLFITLLAQCHFVCTTFVCVYFTGFPAHL